MESNNLFVPTVLNNYNLIRCLENHRVYKPLVYYLGEGTEYIQSGNPQQNAYIGRKSHHPL